MTRTTCLGLVAAAFVGLAAAVWAAFGPTGLLRLTAEGTSRIAEGGCETQEPPVPLVPTEPSRGSPDVTLSPPLPSGPVPLAPSDPPPDARLMQPVPADPPAPEPPTRVTSARLPLARPLEEPQTPEAHSKSTWSSPEPLKHTAPAPVPAQVVTPVGRVSVPRAVSSLNDAPLATPKTRTRPSPFTGTHACTVGDCHDLTLPQAVRRQLGGARVLYAVPGPDRTVLLYTADGLERLSGQLDHSPAAESKVRRARRTVFAQAERCTVDREGRTHLPDPTVRHAGVCGEAMLVGVGDHFELWEASRWDSYLHGRRE